MTTMIPAGEFAQAMEKTGISPLTPRIAVAVSGGADSMALSLLMHQWVKDRGGEMIALTVDHGLRTESAAEAREVRQRLPGIAHETLVWHGEKPSSHVQEKAREARYVLLKKTCHDRGFFTLATAHNLEDQVETFWMRLAHGSGVDGLAAMPVTREEGGITLIRPALSFSRARLRATCTHHGVAWIDDPTNKNEKYLRPRLRQFEETLAAEGLTPERLSRTLQKISDAAEALQCMTKTAAAQCLALHAEGYAALAPGPWEQLPRDIQRRVLDMAINSVSPQAYPVPFEQLEQLRAGLHKGQTLAGCDIFSHGGAILFAREESAAQKRTLVTDGMVWDGRFAVHGFESLEIGALSEDGLRVLRKKCTPPRAFEDLPFKIKRVLPALWRGTELAAVPHAGYGSAAGRISLVKGLSPV